MYPGLLTLGSSYSLRLPILADSGRLQISSPITVADQWRNFTALPLGYMGYQFIGLKNLLLSQASSRLRHSALCFHPRCHKRQQHRSEHHDREPHVADRQRKGRGVEQFDGPNDVR